MYAQTFSKFTVWVRTIEGHEHPDRPEGAILNADGPHFDLPHQIYSTSALIACCEEVINCGVGVHLCVDDLVDEAYEWDSYDGPYCLSRFYSPEVIREHDLDLARSWLYQLQNGATQGPDPSCMDDIGIDFSEEIDIW